MSILIRTISIILENKRSCNFSSLIFITNVRQYTNINDDGESKRPMVTEDEINPNNMSDDDLSEPTTCCMSGCANCVWIEYAEKLSKKLKTSDDDVQKIILEKVSDPNMRAFLSMELRCRKI